MEQHHEQFKALGLRLVAIGVGEPKHAKRYCPIYAPSVQCLSNLELEAYTAYGLRYGRMMHAINPELLSGAAALAAQGFVQGKATGDIAILGGVFIIDTHGIIRYADYDEMASHQLDFDALLKVSAELKSEK